MYCCQFARTRLMPILAVATILVSASPGFGAETVVLKNGIRVVLTPIEGAQYASIVDFVPLGFCDDDKDRTQWSHLLEHVICSSAGSAPPNEINAETMPAFMHLDYSRPADTWKQGVALHRKWLTLDGFGEADVKREIKRVIDETVALANTGKTHKFAIGAWAQAVRFGSTHVAMIEDVKKAEPDRLLAYYKEKLLVGPPPVLSISGKFDRDALVKELEAKIGTISLPKAPAARNGDKLRAEAAKRITWDIASRHLLFYWPLPELDAKGRAELAAATNGLMSTLIFGPQTYHRPTNTFTLVTGVLEIDGGNYLVIDTPLVDSDTTMLNSARVEVDRVMASLVGADGACRDTGRSNLRNQYRQLETANIVRELKRASLRGIPGTDIESGVAVLSGLFEYRHGGRMQEYIRIMSQANDAESRRFLGSVLAREKRREMLIEPKDAPN